MPTPPSDSQHQESGLSIVSADSVVERRGVVSFVSSTDRAGAWSVPRHLRVVAVMGSVRIDFRQARVGPDVSDVELFALMGNVTFVVPPELGVECDVDPLLGSIESEAMSGRPAPGAPTIRITGSAVLSSIEIEVRRLGEDESFRKLRRVVKRVLGPGGRPSDQDPR